MPGYITNGYPFLGTEAEIYNPVSGEWKIRAKAPNKGAYQVKCPRKLEEPVYTV